MNHSVSNCSGYEKQIIDCCIVLFRFGYLSVLRARKESRYSSGNRHEKGLCQEKSRICLSYPGIEDTLIVYPHIRVDFEYPLSDVSKPIVVRSVILMGLRVYTKEKDLIMMLFHLDHKENEKLWNFLDAKVAVWYRNQPYEDVIARAGIDTTAFWGPRIYLSPEK